MCNFVAMKDNKKYIENLQSLDFQMESQDNSSVFLVDNLKQYLAVENISPYIIIALDKAKLYKADAVYFRFFDDGRPPLPQIYLYDNILSPRTEEDYAKIHRAVWSGCEIPVYMIIDRTQIKVFDSRKPVDIVGDSIKSQPIDIIELSVQHGIMKKYRAELFDNGAFWETDDANEHFLNKTVAAERLIKSLKEVRHQFRSQIAQSELADRLLIMCILIKYLEENGIDSNTNQNLAQEFFNEKTGFNTLTEILYNNQLSELLLALSSHFNGGIFQTIDKKTNKNWCEDIKSLNLRNLAIFFDAGASNNLFGWREYSFEHIPVELISNLYEEFLPKKEDKKGKKSETPENGAVYTPAFLVNLLIDECLPLNFNELNENVKLIDPACGSGIFLVTAYKRLIQRWRLKNRHDSQLGNTDPEILKQILKDNIFGIDIHYNSVHLTEFSLQLALCSMLTPRQIWTELKHFDNLEETGNIIEKDFFDYLAEDNFSKDFDLVVGNPPFKELSENEFMAYKDKLIKVEAIEKENINLQIPFYQEALLFLSTSFLLLKKQTGKLCLIMKSGPFLYSGDESKKQNANLAFRSTLFNQYNVKQVIDFTLLKNLFKANVETAAVFIENKLPENNTITHIVIRESQSVAEKSYFEISPYDFFDVPRELATTTPYIWKCDLLGGAQVYHLVNDLKKLPKLEDYLNAKKTEGWDYGQGYIVGNKKYEDKNKTISGKNTIVDRFFKDNGIEKIETQSETHFKDIPNNSQNIFSPPHLMIKKTIGKSRIPMELRDDYLTFRNEILGIHCPPVQHDELQNLANQLKNNNSILRFFIAATSARSGVTRSMYTADLSDLLNLPLFVKEAFNPSISEQIIIDDALNYYIEEFSKGKNSAIHKKIAEKDKHIIPFSKVYCDALNKMYAKGENKYYFSKLIEGGSFFACDYTFGNGDSENLVNEHSDKNLDSLLSKWNPSHSAKYGKVMRIYGTNIIRLVKPKKLIYWLQSTALRDVGDTLEDALNRE
ncbi:type I endonuclease-methyltransferase fusion protein [Bacteroidia bacterium]|nr:type I endonuclease-methyltransferase fusion protein [Bacteroidia bacterium]